MNSLAYLIAKALISGLVIAAVSEVAKRNNTVAAIVHSLPLVSVLALLWLFSETRDIALIARHATGTFWLVLPTLPFFLLLPWLLRRGLGFLPALALALGVTFLLYLLTLRLLRAAHVDL
jgi:uncharacterized membrane protein (GlpM family)